MSTYIVKPKDTLWAIAKVHHLTVERLLAANPQITEPRRIKPGDVIVIPGPASTEKLRIKMSFDGHTVRVSTLSGQLLAAIAARSGVPPNHRHTRNLIKEGRDDLDLETDYRGAKHQGVHDAGPVPENDYTLRLTREMKYEKTGGGWGIGGWWLDEGWFDRNLNPFASDRSEFFLHHDGLGPGTAGCIGVRRAADVRAIRNLLIKAYDAGQREVKVEVDYDD